MTDMTNYYRWLIGARPLSVTSEHSDALQAGALIRNFDFNHIVKDSLKPEDMSQDLWDKGAHCGHNILAYDSTPQGAISSWIEEGYKLFSGTFDQIGHRAALLLSKWNNVQFGYSGNVAIGTDTVRTSSDYNQKDLAYYAYPAPGYMPIDDTVNARTSAWTLELNTLKFDNVEDIKIIVTNLNNNEQYECTKANGKLMYDASWTYIVFAQPTPVTGNKYVNGDKYKVEVEGIKEKTTGKEVKLEYTTEFFDIKDTIVTGYSINGYNNVKMDTANTKKLEQIATFLPDSINIQTNTGKTATIKVDGKWIPDEANQCWKNSANAANLPEDIKDPDNILKEIKIKYTLDSGYKSSYLSGETDVIEESEKNIQLYRYMTGTSKYELYQVVDNNTRGYNSIKHYDQNDDSVIENGNSVYFPMKYTLSDSGTYYAIYYSSGTAYLAGGLDITVREKQVKSISITPPNKTTYKVGDKINIEGGKIEITYDNDTTATIDIEKEYISDFTSTKKGITTVKVTYREKTATFECLIVDNLEKIETEYGKTLKDVELSSDENGTYIWQDDEGTPVGDIGENTFNVKYKPNNNKFSELSDLTVTLDVKQGTPEYKEDIELNATYGDTLSKLTLPTSADGTYVFEQSLDTLVGNVGTNTTSFTVKFVPNDSEHYKTITNIPITIKIAKAIPEYNKPTNLEAGYGDKLKDVVLPDGFEWVNGEQSVGEVGKRTFKAKYVPKDTNNYEIVEDIDIDVTVGKATPDCQKTIEFTATYGDALKTLTLPVAINGTYTWEQGEETLVGNVGVNTFKVIFTPSDQVNFRTVRIPAKITVQKANPQYTVPTDLTATYGDLLESVILPTADNGTFQWQDDGKTPVGNAGERKFKVKFVPTDTQNYNTIENIEVTITVAKANPTYKIPDNLVVEYGKKLSDIKLPSGFSWKDATQSVGAVGERSFAGYYTPDDKENYNIVEVEIPIKVVKATPSYTIPTGLTATYGDTLSEVTLPDGFEWITPDESVGDAGEHTFMAKYTPTDTTNYTVVENIEITVKVNKAKADPIVVPTIPDMVYNPNTHLSDIDLPDGWTWENPSTVPTVGNTGYKAIYTPTDSNNYDYSDQNLEPVLPIKVSKARPTFDAPKLTAYKDETLADVELPKLQNGKFTWQDDLTTSVGDVGTHTFKVTFTPNDTINYETVTDINATIEVGKAKPQFDIPTDLTATYGDTLSSVVLPHGFTWNTPNVPVGDAGNNVFIATFTPDDTENYAIVNNIEITVHVKKKLAEPIDIPTFEEMEYDPNRHLSDIGLPAGWKWDDPSIVPTVNNNGYEAIYTPADTKNYDYSKQNLHPKLKLNIKKIDPNYTIPDNLTIGWGSDISDIVLPEGWTCEEQGTVGELGTHTYKFKYTPKDTNNYNTIYDVEIDVEVVKASPVVTKPNDFTLKKGEKSTLAELELPEGWAWAAPDAKIEESGVYEIIYIPDDTEHYRTVKSQIYINLLSDEEIQSSEEDNIQSADTSTTMSPKTGDNIVMYFAMFGISLITIISTVIIKKKAE